MRTLPVPPDKKREKQRPRQRALKESRLLDQFSETDLRQWQSAAGKLESYHVRLYYHLEGLRRTHQNEINEALTSTKPISREINAWTRIVDYQYSNDPLSAKGSLFRGGRFNIGRDLDENRFPSFPALYIAEDYETAYTEKFCTAPDTDDAGFSGHEFALRTPESFSHVRLNGKLVNLFDLTDASKLRPFLRIIKSFQLSGELRNLATSLRISRPWTVATPGQLRNTMLDLNWRCWPVQYGIPSNSQVFANLLRRAGMEGIIYPSTKGDAHCIALFLENLEGSQSFLELKDKSPTSVAIRRLDNTSWKQLV